MISLPWLKTISLALPYKNKVITIMHIKNIKITDRLFFILQIVLIFILIQGITIALGYFDAEIIALILLLISAFVFMMGFILAKIRDKKHKNSFSAGV